VTTTNTWADLAACLAAVPRLERAACRGRPELFDLTADSPASAIDRAKGICDTVCQAQPACAAWVASTLPHLRPAGVVAGELYGPPPAPPKPKSDPAADERWLRDYLGRRRGGRAVAEQVVAAALANGVPETRLRAARRRLGVTVATGAIGGPVWVLAIEATEVAS
jgi:hypothetical protein